MSSETSPLNFRPTSLQWNLEIWRREEARKKDLERGGIFLVLLCFFTFVFAFVVVPSLDEESLEPAKMQTRASAQGDSARTTTLDDRVFCGLTIHDAGYVNLPNKTDYHYAYWYFESRSQPSVDPLVLWLPGGRGYSSLMALLTANGPCHVLPDLSTKLNPYSWTNESNVVWLDQPVGVGFTCGDERNADYNEKSVGENIYYFLQGFFNKHPELAGRELYIMGESYGGDYVLGAAHYVWEQNKVNVNTPKYINLKGLALGNSLTQPSIQLPHVIDMAIDNAYNISFVNDSQLNEMRVAMPICTSLLNQCSQNTRACVQGTDYCTHKLFMPLLAANCNPYDIRIPYKSDDENFMYSNLSYVFKYLAAPYVQKSLGMDAKSANASHECKSSVYDTFKATARVAKPVHTYVTDLLNANVRVLVYAGDADLVCNWFGIEAWTRALQWKGKDEFNALRETAFITANGTNAGMVRSFNNQLTFLRVFNAGHMVLRDQPTVALAMLNKFLKNETF
ncbi:hypothetical protein PsorP6_000375 [Peronosclerospora sorghi]|uniref:Uncharacterized protein n=1 Tax=Peronosclerospora sorghi TaxID=230839 RepID=A0ACC0WW58_9STRA|nr:hypothetical protein PsorP6_000375 [Peronosclerospora sorghi]